MKTRPPFLTGREPIDSLGKSSTYRFPYLMLFPTSVIAFVLGVMVGKYWF